KADRGELDPFVLVVEGSIPNEAIKEEGYWCGFGNNPATGQPMTTNEWLDRLAPKATAILAVGTCATYGGIHAMAGNPTGAMGVPDYLGWDWRSKAGLPIVCVPGCPIHPDNLSETILYLLYQVAGQAPMIPLDEALRPRWLFEATVHEGCDRAGYYEQGEFATEYGSPRCLVKLGCWGPVVKCNMPKRGWINGVGGCPNVGGICIACTMPGFPDKFMPFMDEPHGASAYFRASSTSRKAKDPRDAHVITSRICGICGDTHATCSVYNQNRAYGGRPPHLGEWIINLGEAAEYMFDHNIFQENLVGVDFCEKMVAETNPGVLEQANNTEAPHAADHGYRTIGDIMRSLNPLEGEF